MRPIHLAIAASLAGASVQAQWVSQVRPFTAGVIMVGAQGFARPPITSAVAGGYAHAPVANLLVGIHGSSTFAEGEQSHATHAVATLGYAQRRGLRWQVYPFIAAGGASVRTSVGDASWEPAFGAGFGFESILSAQPSGAVIGGRIGYMTRNFSDDESVAYAAIGIGVGGRKANRGVYADR